MPVVDVHSHDVPRGWPDLAEATGAPGPWPRLRIESERDAMILMDDQDFRRITSQCWDPEIREADMTARRAARRTRSLGPGGDRKGFLHIARDFYSFYADFIFCCCLGTWAPEGVVLTI